MIRRVYWGFAFIIILLLGVLIGLLIRNTDTEPDVVYKPLSPEEIEQVNRNIQDIIKKKKAPTPRPGYKIVPHGDHYHEVPISETGPNTSVSPVLKTENGGLTYHAELLETNPVKALRLQQEERGHWSAEWIPPFPPDDSEAQAFARAQYLFHYYRSIGDTDNPIKERAIQESGEMLDVITEYPFGARKYDLLKLTWPSLRAGSTRHTDGVPSDYFPNYHTEKGLELLRPYLLGHKKATNK